MGGERKPRILRDRDTYKGLLRIEMSGGGHVGLVGRTLPERSDRCGAARVPKGEEHREDARADRRKLKGELEGERRKALSTPSKKKERSN